jgi:benzoate/toluate 1,2-dioxygenase alpha subunit
MAYEGPALDLSDRFDDRAEEDHEFRLHRSIFEDQEIFDAEIEFCFEKLWNYLCHESQLPNPGDYYATHIGNQPVVVYRQDDGSIKAFINACSHRGAIITPFKQGNAKTLTCRFHGWSYKCSGECIGIKNEEGGYGAEFNRAQYNLTEIAEIGDYRGFIFGALTDEVPTLEEHLGEAKFFIDLFADQSPDGLEMVKGSQTYLCGHDWKVQADNVTDGYHVSTVHRNFMHTIMARESREGAEGMMKTEVGRIKGDVKNGMYYLGNGHMCIWADRSSPEGAPLAPATDYINENFDETKAHWMLRRGRNIIVFPNLVLNDLASTHLRTHRPVGPGQCEVTIWCIAPKQEPDAARVARLRKFEDFFLVSGLSTSDDVVSLDTAQAGFQGSEAGWNNYDRGLKTLRSGPDEEAKKVGIDPEFHCDSWDYEGAFVGWYRHWRKLVEEGTQRGQTQIAVE